MIASFKFVRLESVFVSEESEGSGILFLSSSFEHDGKPIAVTINIAVNTVERCESFFIETPFL